MKWPLRLAAFLSLYSTNAFVVEAKYLEIGRSLPLAIAVCDRVGIDAKTLQAAETSATYVFQRAGLDVRWLNGGDCSVLPVGPYVLVVIDELPPQGWATPDAMGLAVVHSENHRRAYVFYSRVREFAAFKTSRGFTQAESIALGHVIAHEVGHLLIPAAPHSARGILRSRWRLRDWEQAASGHLLFQPDQVRLIRRTLEYRDR